MKTLKFLLAGAVALMAFAGCSDDVEEPFTPNQENNQNQETEYDETYYAENASISCSDPKFTVTDDGVIVSFKVSGGEITIDVDCGTEWTAQNSAEDIFNCTIKSTSVTITAEQNLVEAELTGTIKLVTMPSQIEFAAITVTQDGMAYITLSDEEFLLSNSEGSISVTVESNFEWTYNCDDDWFTIEKDEEKSSMKIAYTANTTGIDRETVVTITAGDGASNVAEAELKITQSWENIDALILEYTITLSSTTIGLPIRALTRVTIDWDDGTTTTTSSNWPSHTYSTPGIYTVTINGTVKTICSYYNNGSPSGRAYLTGVKQWGNTGLTSMESAFRACSGLTSLPDGAGPFSNITLFDYAFYNCSSLEELPEGLFDNCPSVTTFEACFSRCSSLTSLPTGLIDNCTSVTTFQSCFSGCSGLTAIPAGLFDNCPSVTTFEACFYGCSGLTSLPAGLFDNCQSVTTFERCFYECNGLTSVPYDLFSNCTEVTTFYRCFYNCSSLVSAPSFEGLSKVTTFEGCFYNCTPLVSPPSFKGCSSATNFSYTLSGCDKLVVAPSFEGCSRMTSVPGFITDNKIWTTLPENMFAGCSKITSFSSCFASCTALETVPDNLFSECTSATTFSSVFYNCSALKSVPVNIFDGASAAVYFGSAFYGCSSVIGESPYTEFEINGENMKIHLYERGDYYLEIRYSNPTSYSNCFTNSTFSDIDSIPSSWGGNGN